MSLKKLPEKKIPSWWWTEKKKEFRVGILFVPTAATAALSYAPPPFVHEFNFFSPPPFLREFLAGET